MINIADILRNHGPMRSSKLKQLLMNKGLSDVAARKQISRAKDEVIRFTHFYLPKGEFFLYLKEQFCEDDFFTELIASHEESRTIYAHTFFALDPYAGIIPSYLLGKVSGSPERQKGHISLERLKTQLIAGRLIYNEIGPGLGPCLIKNNLNRSKIDFKLLRSQLLAEKILIDALSAWIRSNGFGSFNKVKTREKDDMPNFCHHYWDICAPSYLRPIATVDNGVLANGFFVADVIFSSVNYRSIQAFISKVQRCRNMRNSRPFLAMLVVKCAEKEAFDAARKAGILITTVKNILNEDISNLLLELLNTLNNAADVVLKDPEKIIDLFESLSKIEGAAINLRGSFFEMMAGHIITKTQNVNNIDLNYEIHDEKLNTEIDVVGIRNSSITCYECKGYIHKNKIKKEMIERWLKNISAIYDYYHNKYSSVNFEFWTTSDFEEDALELLTLKKLGTKKYSLEWKNGNAILDLLKKEKLTGFTTLLNQYYFRNPLYKFIPELPMGKAYSTKTQKHNPIDGEK